MRDTVKEPDGPWLHEWDLLLLRLRLTALFTGADTPVDGSVAEADGADEATHV